jgi:hypothetical protein
VVALLYLSRPISGPGGTDIAKDIAQEIHELALASKFTGCLSYKNPISLNGRSRVAKPYG